MDADAKEDAECIVELLTDAGIQAVLAGRLRARRARGRFRSAGAGRRRRPRRRADRRESAARRSRRSGCRQSDLDLETIVSATSEMEAMGIKNLLESNGIAAVLVGDSVLPNFPFEVRVARDQVERARISDRRRGRSGAGRAPKKPSWNPNPS